MPKNAGKVPADYILSLHINGLSGRMVKMAPPKDSKREYLFVYGHHASLERYFGFAEYLNEYGGVTMPDLPGFGGMDSFYKIGEKPSLDNMADYLAAFVKLRYRGQRFSVVGFSLGLMIVTRMLQKYPQVAKKIDLVVSCAGFVHKDDFKFKNRDRFLFRWGASIISKKIPSLIGRYIILAPPFIRLGYRFGEAVSFNAKVATIGEKDRKARINFEIQLWHCNDVRTYADISVTMFKLDLTGKHVNLPVYHVAVENDHYFNNLSVEQHMRMIYTDFHSFKVHLPAHLPTVLASAKDVVPYIPPSLRRVMRKKSNLSILRDKK